MSLFVAGLAFDGHAELLTDAKIGILTGSVLSAIVGAVIFTFSTRNRTRNPFLTLPGRIRLTRLSRGPGEERQTGSDRREPTGVLGNPPQGQWVTEWSAGCAVFQRRAIPSPCAQGSPRTMLSRNCELAAAPDYIGTAVCRRCRHVLSAVGGVVRPIARVSARR